MSLSSKFKRWRRQRSQPRTGKSRFRPITPARLFLFFNLSFIAAVFLMGFRPDAWQKKITTGDLAFYNNHSLTLSGRVCEEADVDIKSRKLTVCVKGQTKGRVLITTDLYPAYNYGNFIKITGLLTTPPKFDGFDYENYLARYDIYSVMYYPKIESASGTLSASQRAYLGLMKIKWRLKGIIDTNLPEPEAGLGDALLLGYNHTVEKSDMLTFSRVGISHIIAISGSHITILSAMIVNFFLALGLSRRRSLLVVFAFLILYPLVTGLAASAVRSAIMGALAFLAIYHGRTSSLLNSLIFAAAIMLLFNPLLLSVDIGFQLSFAAILGIIYIYPLGDGLTKNFLEPKKWRTKTKKIVKTGLETINLTLVSQIVILPIALVNFKQLSLIAPLANILTLWTFPLLLGALIVGIFLAALVPFLGLFWFLPAYLFLKFIFVIADWLAKPSWAAVMVSNFNWWWGGGYYFILAGLIWTVRQRIDKAKRSG